ncbi:MAG TPA: DUF4386 family protein [Promineifilum sp.]|nr:DUF4386 family protein [Promineifilum sp.]
MNRSFDRFGGLSAMMVGVLSILYAIFFLVITPRAEATGALGSWIILAISGVFSSAAFVALYLRLRPASEGFALWGLVLGLFSSFATLVHGAWQALLLTMLPAADQSQRAAIELVRMVVSPVDPAGVATFGVIGLASLVTGMLIIGSGRLPRMLGYLAVANAVLLVALYFATAAGAQTLILLSGGLTSVLVGPIYWVWLGRELRRETAPAAMAAPSMA